MKPFCFAVIAIMNLQFAALHADDANAPVVIMNPGAVFQDNARPGAMIIGMDRTPRGRIWGCWTGTGDKKRMSGGRKDRRRDPISVKGLNFFIVWKGA